MVAHRRLVHMETKKNEMKRGRTSSLTFLRNESEEGVDSRLRRDALVERENDDGRDDWGTISLPEVLKARTGANKKMKKQPDIKIEEETQIPLLC